MRWKDLVVQLPMLMVAVGAIGGFRRLSLFGLIALAVVIIYRKQFFNGFGILRAAQLGFLAVVAFLWAFHGPTSAGPLVKGIEMYSIAIALPLIMVKLQLNARELQQILRSIAIIILLLYLATLLGGIYNYLFSKHPYVQSEFLVYTDLAESVVYTEPIYLSMVGAVGAVLAFNLFSNIFFRYGSVLFLTMVIVLLNARTVLAIHCFAMAMLLGKEILKTRNLKLLFVVLISGAIIATMWIAAGKMHTRPGRDFVVDVKTAWERSLNPEIDFLDNGVVIRIAMWRTASEVIAAYPWFGVGTANERQVLSEYNRSKGFKYLADEKLNCHNGYLSLLVTFGFIGAGLLLIAYGSQAIRLLRGGSAHRSTYFFFVIVIMGAMVTESILNRFHGLAFVLFINTMLMLISEKE